VTHTPYFANAAVFMVSPDQIDPDLDGRIGLFFPAKAEALAALIGAHGQNDPIKVVKRGNAAKMPWNLVAGLHRLEACRALGIDVAAIEVCRALGIDAGKLRDIQASENMDRRELEPIERAMFVHAVAEAAKARVLEANGGKSQQQIAISMRWNKVRFAAPERGRDADADTADMMSARMGWEEHVAASLSLNARTIRRDLALHRGLVAPFPEESRLLATRDIGRNRAELTKLIKLPVGERGGVIKALLQYPGLSSVEEALLHLNLRKKAVAAEGQDKFATHFLSNWGRMSITTQRLHLPAFVAEMKPSIRAALRALLDVEEAG
jgi:ParB family transcriptional regulator, chromosome partitioning protein